MAPRPDAAQVALLLPLTIQVQAYALHASMVGLHTLAFFKSVRRLGARSTVKGAVLVAP